LKGGGGEEEEEEEEENFGILNVFISLSSISLKNEN